MQTNTQPRFYYLFINIIYLIIITGGRGTIKHF